MRKTYLIFGYNIIILLVYSYPQKSLCPSLVLKDKTKKRFTTLIKYELQA